MDLLLSMSLLGTFDYAGDYINDETVKKCNSCDIVVAGSYIINSDNFQDKISSLRWLYMI